MRGVNRRRWKDARVELFSGRKGGVGPKPVSKQGGGVIWYPVGIQMRAKVARRAGEAPSHGTGRRMEQIIREAAMCGGRSVSSVGLRCNREKSSPNESCECMSKGLRSRRFRASP